MLSFYEMTSMVEANDNEKIAKQLTIQKYGELLPDEYQRILAALNRGEDGAGLVRSKARDLDKYKRISAPGSTRDDITDLDRQTKGGHREPEAPIVKQVDDTGTELARLRHQNVLGAEDARIIWNIINTNARKFEGQAFSPEELFSLVNRLGYREHGVNREIKPQTFMAALKILTGRDKDIRVPFIKAEKVGDQVRISLAQDDATKGAKDQLAQVAPEVQKRILDREEAKHGPRYKTLGDKTSDLAPGGLSPHLKELLASAEATVNQAYKAVENLSKLGFGDEDEVSGLVEKVKQYAKQIKSAGLPEEIKDKFYRDYLNLHGEAAKMYSHFSQANPLRDAKEKLVAAKRAIISAESNPTDVGEHSPIVDAAVDAADAAIRALIKHPSVANHPETMDQAKQMFQSLKTAHSSWMHQLDSLTRPQQRSAPAPTPDPVVPPHVQAAQQAASKIGAPKFVRKPKPPTPAGPPPTRDLGTKMNMSPEDIL